MNKKFLIVLRRDRNRFVAIAPILPGCFAIGRTAKKALANVCAAIKRWYRSRSAKVQDASKADAREIDHSSFAKRVNARKVKVVV